MVEQQNDAKPAATSWTTTAIVAGVVSAILTAGLGIVALYVPSPANWLVLGSVGVGLLAFIVVLILNPKRVYRRAASTLIGLWAGALLLGGFALKVDIKSRFGAALVSAILTDHGAAFHIMMGSLIGFLLVLDFLSLHDVKPAITIERPATLVLSLIPVVVAAVWLSRQKPPPPPPPIPTVEISGTLYYENRPVAEGTAHIANHDRVWDFGRSSPGRFLFRRVPITTSQKFTLLFRFQGCVGRSKCDAKKCADIAVRLHRKDVECEPTDAGREGVPHDTTPAQCLHKVTGREGDWSFTWSFTSRVPKRGLSPGQTASGNGVFRKGRETLMCTVTLKQYSYPGPFVLDRWCNDRRQEHYRGSVAVDRAVRGFGRGEVNRKGYSSPFEGSLHFGGCP